MVFLPSIRNGSLRVERSNQPSSALRSGDDARAVGDESVDERHVRSVGDALDLIGERHVFGHKDVGFYACGGCVGCGCSASVACGGHGDLANAVMACHGHGQGQSASLEGAGGVGSFSL